MKKQLTTKKEQKLNLGKIDIYNFPTTLDRDEQERVKGGTAGSPGGTAVPIICKP